MCIYSLEHIKNVANSLPDTRLYFENRYIDIFRIVTASFFSSISEDKSETSESDEKQIRQCLWFPWTWILHNTTKGVLCRRPAFTESRRLRSNRTTSTCQPTWNICFNFRKTDPYPRSVGGCERQRIQNTHRPRNGLKNKF